MQEWKAEDWACRKRNRCAQGPERANGQGDSRIGCPLEPHRGVDGEGEVSSTAAVHRHVGFLHTSALQADLKRNSPSQECPTWFHPRLASLTFTLTRNHSRLYYNFTHTCSHCEHPSPDREFWDLLHQALPLGLC